MNTGTKLPVITGQSVYRGKYFDRSPQCIPAGSLTSSGDTVEQTLHPKDERPPSPDVVRKFRSSFNPDIGQMRIFHGKAYDPQRQWATEMSHGISIKSLASTKEMVNPEVKTLFQEKLVDRRASSYSRQNKAALGKSHDQAPGLPKDLDPLTCTFGRPIQYDPETETLINPNKSVDQVFKEASEGHDLYVRSHADYYPRQRVCRNYTSPNFHPQNRYGLPTPHCNEGKKTKAALLSIQETQEDLATKIVNKRLEDFRERYKPQVGQSINPSKYALNICPEHTFGAVHKPDPFCAGDLIHNRKLDNLLKRKECQRAVVAAVRQQLKKLNYFHFNNLLEAFRFYDQKGRGKITLSDLRDVCMKYKLPVDADLIEKVLDYCDVDQDGMISYIEFANFLNWKDIMPTGLDDLGSHPELIGADDETVRAMKENPPAKLIDENDLVPKNPLTTEVTVRHLEKHIDFNVGDHILSSSRYNAVVGPGGIPSHAFRIYGIPTIRSDLPAPCIKRLSDLKNYGDEAHMYSVMFPSLYSQHNVYERDLLQPRTYAEIQSIFTNIGVRMTGEDMEELYKMVASSNPKGFVSVDSFKKVLDLLQARQI